MTRTTRQFHRFRLLSSASIAFASAFLVAALAVSVSAGSLVTKGPIPETAFLPGGDIDVRLVPDFVPVWARDGETIAGYVPKQFVLNPIPPGVSTEPLVVPDQPVLGPDLKSIVGHMVAGKGFVPIGVSPESIPNIPVQVTHE